MTLTTDAKSGLALILGSLASLAILGLHPTGHDIVASSMQGESNALNTGVHALAIAAEALLVLGTLGLTLRLAGQRDLAVSAFVVFALAMSAMIIAAVASGLIATSVAAAAARAEGSAREAMLSWFHYTGHVNQAFAKVGFSFASVAIGLWSVAMIRDGFSRGLGVFGVVIAAAMLAGFAFSGGRLVIHGFGGLVMLGQTVWTIAAGWLLLKPTR